MRSLIGFLLLGGLANLATVFAEDDGNGSGKKVVPSLPGPQEWKNTPTAWKYEANRLTISAGKATDWYTSPVDGVRSANAPVVLFKPARDFVLTARVMADLSTKWNAATLMVYVDDANWAKFAIEKSMYLEPTTVTVVTRGISDDCNSAVLAGNSSWLRVVKLGQAIGFFSSADRTSWRLVRAFTLGDAPELRVGFGSQSPVGEGATAVFSDIEYRPERVKDFLAGE
jgi:uncharacterized protein